MKKRLIRILPLYYWATFMALFFNFLLQSSGVMPVQVIDSFVKSMLIIPHASIVNPEKIFPIFIPGWTITFELWFYLVIAASSLVARGKNCIKAVPLILFSTYLFSATALDGVAQEFFGSPLWILFGIGIGVRLVETKKVGHGEFLTFALVSFSTAGAVSGFDSRLIQYGTQASLIFLSAFLLIKKDIFALSFIGRISFSLYITHVFVINAIEMLFRKVFSGGAYNLELMLTTAFLVSIAVASVSYEIFEKRLDRALRRRLL